MPRLSKIGAACLAAFGWTTGGSAAVTGTYLQIAGGGGGGGNEGGGGGAGGYLTGTTSLDGTLTYTVTVGAGGAGGTSSVDASQGSNSQFGTLTASVGGGFGGSGKSPSSSYNGGSGGSGGGSARGAYTGGSATSGQGYAGGSSQGSSGYDLSSGGGGAGAVGVNGTTSPYKAGDGGAGVASSISGTSTYYAGGGGGGTYTGGAAVGVGGIGGGGNGGIAEGTTDPTAGSANSGGGGGGACGSGGGSRLGGTGGSGVVIVSYPAPQIFWGGFVTTSGGNIIHTFTTSGSLTPVSTSVTANYLVVAGGAAGGNGGSGAGGGGGAGGYRTGTSSLSLSSSYTVIVGAGGVALNPAGGYGSDSTFSTITSNGGGGGTGAAGNPGGSGGGGGGGGGAGLSYSGGAGNTPSTSPSQGNNGGNNAAGGYLDWAGGGGGGAGAAGQNAPGINNAGAGGAGTASSISGTSVTYAGGGGGGTWNTGTSGGAGGAGGGGAGGKGAGSLGTNGTISLGAGGGGGGQDANGGYGGSGIVIVSYPGSTPLFGGGVVTYAGGYTIHTFNTSGTLTPIVALSASYLIVAGGGAGGGEYYGGGGGAGGLLQGSGVTIDTNSTYLVTVGAGGAAVSSGIGNNGTNSSFSVVPVTAIGGGGGAGYTTSPGQNGGSGGGGNGDSGTVKTGGSGTSGQGFAGGSGFATSGGNAAGTTGGGGGGAGAAGTTSSGSGGSANGGVGVSSSISGTATYYAGGGGGGTYSSTTGQGGNGGGGAGSNGTTAVSGTANTGGGGGGGDGHSGGSSASGAGGSGIVIISYAGSTQLMAGGTVTITGGYVIHTFTSSGYLSPLTYVGNSLRFRKSVNGYLSRTMNSSSTTYTVSAWVKRGLLSGYQYIFASGPGTASNDKGVAFDTSTNKIYAWNGSSQALSTAVFRDPAAWYHVVMSVNSGTATVYVNNVNTGISQSSMSLGTYGRIGRFNDSSSANDFDGYMAEFRLIDGQALTPNSFGSFNSYGVWQPITYGGSYGTNGYYLTFNRTTSYSNQFDQTPSYLYLSSGSAAAPVGNSTWSIECWTNWIGTPASYNWDLFTNSQSGGVQAVYIGAQSKWEIGAYGVADVLPATVITPQSDMVGRWNHLVFTSNGTQLRIFLNGVMIGYGASSYSFAASRSNQYIGTNAGTDIGTINGYISNLRVCLGSIPTTYQTSSTTINDRVFTSPTSDLTTTSQGATNVSLLTCQNATFIDNSTNGFTISSAGSPTANLLSPFGAQPFNDQGPSGNNWLPNNISSALNYTLDEMIDVPTLTSATVANYAVLNPLDFFQTNSGSSIGNGNLSLTTASGNSAVRSSIAVSETGGKWYAEATNSVVTNGGRGWAWGFASATADLASVPSTAGKYIIYADSTGAIYNGTSTITSGLGAFAAGTILQIAYDPSNGYAWVGKNNTWYNSAGSATGNPAAGTNPTFILSGAIFACMQGAGSGLTGYANFGQQPFTYTPPSGFVRLNTYNL